MALLAVDEVMLREPRLLVQKMAPVGPVKLDHRQSVVKKLLCYANMHTAMPYDMVTNKALTAVNGPTFSPLPSGPAWAIAQTGAKRFEAQVAGFEGTGCCCEVFGSLTAGSHILFSWVENGNSYHQLGFPTCTIYDGGTVNVSTMGTGEGLKHWVIGGLADDAYQRLWINGVDVTTSGQDAKRSFDSGIKTMRFGYHSNSMLGTTGQIHYYRMWKNLTTAEMAALAADPFSIVVPA